MFWGAKVHKRLWHVLSKPVILDSSIMITLPRFLLSDKERQLCLLIPHMSWKHPWEQKASASLTPASFRNT